MSDRDVTTGRFLPGNRAGVGNPSGRRGRPKTYYTEYQDELHETLTPEAWRRIVSKAIDQAIDGDHRARQFLASYVIGQPTQMMVADVHDERDQFIAVIEAIREVLPSAEEEEA